MSLEQEPTEYGAFIDGSYFFAHPSAAAWLAAARDAPTLTVVTTTPAGTR